MKLLLFLLLASTVSLAQGIGGKAGVGGNTGFGGGAAAAPTWAFVKATTTIANFCPTGTACTLSVTATAGDTVLVQGLYDQALSISSVTDSASGSYTALYTPASNFGSAGNHNQQFLYCIASVGSITSVTVNFSAQWTATGPEYNVLEYSGGSCTQDGVTNDTTLHASPWTSNSITPTAGKADLLLCTLWATSAALTYTAPFTLVKTSGGSYNEGYIASSGAQILTSASGSYTCSGTSTGGVNPVLIALQP